MDYLSVDILVLAHATHVLKENFTFLANQDVEEFSFALMNALNLAQKIALLARRTVKINAVTPNAKKNVVKIALLAKRNALINALILYATKNVASLVTDLDATKAARRYSSVNTLAGACVENLAIQNSVRYVIHPSLIYFLDLKVKKMQNLSN